MAIPFQLNRRLEEIERRVSADTNKCCLVEIGTYTLGDEVAQEALSVAALAEHRKGCPTCTPILMGFVRPTHSDGDA